MSATRTRARGAEPPATEGGAAEEAPAPETPKAGANTTTAVVDYAKSGRSTCRVCGDHIPQGELRLGFEVEMRRRAPGITAIGWRHLQCFKPPVGMRVHHLRGASELRGGDRARVAARLREAEREQEARGLGPRRSSRRSSSAAAAAAAEPPKPKPRRRGEIAARGVSGKRAAAAQARAHPHAGDEHFWLTPGAGVTPERERELHDKYGAMSNADLKEVLRANEQLLGGAKAELVARCVDGELRGGLPACPTCGVGRLHVEYDARSGQPTYRCPGFFDNEAKTFVRCTFVSNSVERTKWVMPGGEQQRAPGVA